MEYKEVKEALEKFGEAVVESAKTNLKKNDLAGGNLYNSLKTDLTVEQNAFLLDFLMEDYGMFQDAGVWGAKPSLATSYKYKRQGGKRVKAGVKYKGRQKGRATNSIFTGATGIKNKFSYKSKMPPMQPLMQWAKRKNIRFRDDKGRFAKGNYRTIGFWLQKRIFAQGLKPTLFFSKAFRKEFKKLPSELLEAFVTDVERQLILGIKK
jgi:hypothetical protein|tara:strand:- start:253 stop:876 length:624 start_codon:yes stop_codon:yes gene_type:complete